MTGERERIDRLLDANAARQLARVDWDRLTDEIATWLDQAQQIETPLSSLSAVSSGPSPGPALFKIAAGIAAAAAVICTVVMLRSHEPSEVQVPEGRAAVVEFVDRQGGALIQINDQASKSLVVIHTGHDDRRAAKCVVSIIDRNGDLERGSSRAAWIIISRPQRTLADNGQSKEETDVMCML